MINVLFLIPGVVSVSDILPITYISKDIDNEDFVTKFDLTHFISEKVCEVLFRLKESNKFELYVGVVEWTATSPIPSIVSFQNEQHEPNTGKPNILSHLIFAESLKDNKSNISLFYSVNMCNLSGSRFISSSNRLSFNGLMQSDDISLDALLKELPRLCLDPTANKRLKGLASSLEKCDNPELLIQMIFEYFLMVDSSVFNRANFLDFKILRESFNLDEQEDLDENELDDETFKIRYSICGVLKDRTQISCGFTYRYFQLPESKKELVVHIEKMFREFSNKFKTVNRQQ